MLEFSDLLVLDLKGGNTKFNFGGTRIITAVDAHDINGDGLDDLALGFEDTTNTVYRSIIYFTTGKASPTPADLKLKTAVLTDTFSALVPGDRVDLSRPRPLSPSVGSMELLVDESRPPN